MAESDLLIGQTVSHYRIIEKLGEGGMGVVWKAHDTRLGRFVALKTLPVEKLADLGRKHRFVNEAKSASALNHPNIVHIYDISDSGDIPFIAMEYVAGKTLDHWIGRKGLQLNEALKYAVQIADALATAHAGGIVHRDLKPSNLIVSDSGLVKVLDFGLAKLTEKATNYVSETETLGVPSSGTEEGTIAGTIAYMSPEQAEGKKVDSRSDIFSFGSVMYEMVTGKCAFRADSKLSTLSAILKDEPKPMSSLMPDVPRELEKVISRCLRKDPARRFQHMDDLKVALLDLKEESESGELRGVAKPGGRAQRMSRLVWAGGIIVLIAVGGVWLRFYHRADNGTPPRIVPLTSHAGIECCPSFSADGNQVAFVWNGPKQNNDDIYIKLIGTENAVRLTTDSAADSSPAWSPDGRYIAFLREVSESKQGVFLVPAIGGPERKLMETQSGWGGLAWHPDGRWLAIPDQDGIWLFSVDTAEKRKVTFPASGSCDDTPAFSPDGEHLAFSRNLANLLSEIYLLELSHDLTPKGEPKQLTYNRRLSKWPTWTADGRELIFSSGTGPETVTYELWRIRVAGGGPPQPLLGVSVAGATPTISHRGDRLAYTRANLDTNIWRLEVPGPNGGAGEPVSFISSTYPDEAPQYSPDGKKIAFVSGRSGHNELWVCASDGSNAVQLTSLGFAGSPRWSPDGQRIVFDSNVEGQFQLYMIDAGGGSPRRVTHESADSAVASWSRDGRWIYFVSNRTKEWQVWKLPAEGGEAVQVTKQGGYVAFESLDGKFLYFVKDIWHTSLWRVPVDGGEETRILESLEGRAFALGRTGVYFVSPESNGTSAVQFLSFATSKVATLAAIRRPVSWGLSVSPDERFILYTQSDQESQNLMLMENFR